MGNKYAFHDHDKLYFVTLTVIKWIDIFTRDIYRNIFYDSVAYCQKEKGLEVYAYCLMTNHVHMIIGRSGEPNLSEIIRDLKSFTSRHIRKALESTNLESRKRWIMKLMKDTGLKNHRNKDFQLWVQNNHPVELNTNFMMDQRLAYIHNNPVKAGFVEKPEDWLHSSAREYCGTGKGILELIFIE